MARPKKTKEVVEIETPVVEIETTEYSQEYVDYKNLIEAYAVQNPEKYEQKKEELLAHLNTLK